jgi:2-methylcitrate dehydratase PrpD
VMARIEAAPHPDMSPASTAHFGAEVTVTTTDGRRLAKAVDIARGRTSANPLPRSALEAKYRDCAGRAVNPDAVERSLDMVTGMEAMGRVSALSDLFAASTRDQASLARAS